MEGKYIHGLSHGQAPKQQRQQQQQQSTSDPVQHTQSKTTGTVPASATPTAGANGYKTASKAVVAETDPAAYAASIQNDDGYACIRVPKEKSGASGYQDH